jgi:protein ImuB
MSSAIRQQGHDPGNAVAKPVGSDMARSHTPPGSASKPSTQALWLGAYFPHLPLEIYARAAIHETPLVISSTTGNRPCVLFCNDLALACGIQPNMAISAAYALAATLIVQPRNEGAEREALAHLAAWAIQFTPVVSLVPPNAMVMEVGGSLKLFKGLRNLLARLKKGIEELGYAVRLSIAPTPLGATLFARAGVENPVNNMRELRSRLVSLPLQSLDLDTGTLTRLTNLGLHHIGDCLRMPRDGLARRFGPQLLLDLDRASGKAPDVRPRFVPPPRFTSRLLLPAAANSCEALAFATHRLLLELCGFLRTRSGGIEGLALELGHPKGPPTRVALELVSASRDAAYLHELLRLRLERLTLPGPVEAIRLHAGNIVSLPARGRNLFSADSSAIDKKTKAIQIRALDWLTRQSLSPSEQPQLIERLRARLGNEAVCGLCLVPEHRPERSQRSCAPGEAVAPSIRYGKRPLWLLLEPLPLKTRQDHPWLKGRLHLLAGPERIESGWWDGEDIARDYFVAANPQGSCFWIFREHGDMPHWFLHGIFA